MADLGRSCRPPNPSGLPDDDLSRRALLGLLALAAGAVVLWVLG